MGWQLTPQPGPATVPPNQGTFLSQLLSRENIHRQDAFFFKSYLHGVEHAKDPGCGDLPGPLTTERLFLLHAAPVGRDANRMNYLLA